MSPEKIVENIKFYRDLGFRSFILEHDSFFVNEKRIAALCDCFEKNLLDIKWYVTGRIDNLNNKMIDRMVACGLAGVNFGIESGSPKIQSSTGKNLDLKSAYEQIVYMKNKGLSINAYFMYGFPEETSENLNETLNYIIDLSALKINIEMSFCAFSSNSELSNRYYEKLYFNPANFNILNKSKGVNEERELIEKHKAVFSYLYDYDCESRKNYRFLDIFALLLNKFEYTAYYLREIYGNTNLLKMYNDFVIVNRSDLNSLVNNERPLKNRVAMFENFLNKSLEKNIPNMIRSIFKFELDLKRVKTFENIINIYDFDYDALVSYKPLAEVKLKKTGLIISKTENELRIGKI